MEVPKGMFRGSKGGVSWWRRPCEEGGLGGVEW